MKMPLAVADSRISLGYLLNEISLISETKRLIEREGETLLKLK